MLRITSFKSRRKMSVMRKSIAQVSKYRKRYQIYSVYISIITPQVIPNKSFILCSPCLHRSPCARVCVLHSLTVTNHSQNSHTVRIRFSDCTKYLNVYIGNVVYTNLLKTLWYKSKIHACILQQKCFKKQLYKLQHWLITECYINYESLTHFPD